MTLVLSVTEVGADTCGARAACVCSVQLHIGGNLHLANREVDVLKAVIKEMKADVGRSLLLLLLDSRVVDPVSRSTGPKSPRTPT